jgi:hypothetical protein
MKVWLRAEPTSILFRGRTQYMLRIQTSHEAVCFKIRALGLSPWPMASRVQEDVRSVGASAWPGKPNEDNDHKEATTGGGRLAPLDARESETDGKVAVSVMRWLTPAWRHSTESLG